MTDPSRPPIRTQADLERTWRLLMGPGGYGASSLWMMLILDDRPVPHLVEITGADDPPDPEEKNGFVSLLRSVGSRTGPGLRVAFLRSRPGTPAVTARDRTWAAVYAATRAAGVGCEVVHLATRGDVRPVPPDDLSTLATA